MQLLHSGQGTPLHSYDLEGILVNATWCRNTHSHQPQEHPHLGDSSQRCLHWISYVDKYGPTLHYVEGSANVVTDTFSQLVWNDTPASPTVGKEEQHSPTSKRTLESDKDVPLESFFSLADDCEMLQCFTCLPTEECYLNLPDDLVTDNPLI